jgi:type II secretory pathway pseudopilin PulG
MTHLLHAHPLALPLARTRAHRGRRRSQQGAHGFSLAEVVIASGVFLILAGAALTLGRTAMQREEINAVAISLNGWLDAIQRAAQRTTGGCTVRFRSGAALAPGDVLASVEPASCANESSFQIGALNPGTTIQAQISPPSQDGTLAFTPRGTVTLVEDMTLTLRHSAGSFTRCLRLAATSGFLSVGADENGGACAESSFGEAI